IPGSMPATSQLEWLSSTTAMIVLFWSRATRDLLRSFGWGIAALHRENCSDEVAIPRRPPHSVYRSPRERNGHGRAPKSILAISDLTLRGSADRADVPIGNAQQSLLQQRDSGFESSLLQSRVIQTRLSLMITHDHP